MSRHLNDEIVFENTSEGYVAVDDWADVDLVKADYQPVGGQLDVMLRAHSFIRATGTPTTPPATRSRCTRSRGSSPPSPELRSPRLLAASRCWFY
jgi:hypothetical protein